MIFVTNKLFSGNLLICFNRIAWVQLDYGIYSVSSCEFVTGSRMLENVSLVEKANADGQQNLQSLVQHYYPDDRLRYSKLLLSLYTLFGINCNMLESLFCRHLIPSGNGGLQKFICTEFMTSKSCTDDGWYLAQLSFSSWCWGLECTLCNMHAFMYAFEVHW